jgi:hypothetical protein
LATSVTKTGVPHRDVRTRRWISYPHVACQGCRSWGSKICHVRPSHCVKKLPPNHSRRPSVGQTWPCHSVSARTAGTSQADDRYRVMCVLADAHRRRAAAANAGVWHAICHTPTRVLSIGCVCAADALAGCRVPGGSRSLRILPRAGPQDVPVARQAMAERELVRQVVSHEDRQPHRSLPRSSSATSRSAPRSILV